MADGFAELIDRANTFFTDLAANNTKDWFQPRAEMYKTDIAKPAGLLADLVAEDLGTLTGEAHKPKVFRIHRDVRFSKDKTPYNTHLHLMWSRPDSDTAPVWFFGASPEYLTVGQGVMGLRGPSLSRYRALVDREGSDLEAALSTAERSIGAAISDWGPEPLKRVPKPYDQEHPQANLLKRKGLIISAPPRDTWRDGLIPALKATMEGMMPLWRILDAGMR